MPDDDSGFTVGDLSLRISGAVSGGPSANPDDDWPPASFADNDHVLVWWVPEYDAALRDLIARWQWAWRWHLLEVLQDLIPETILAAWRAADPLCREYSWYNVLHNFAIARAKQLGLSARAAERKTCPVCAKEFDQSELASAIVSRVGVDAADCCRACLSQALYNNGSKDASISLATAVLQSLDTALGRPPLSKDFNGEFDWVVISPDARALAVRALMVKPTITRVKELFGSWAAAVEHAETATTESLPPYAPPRVATPRLGEDEFVSTDPEVYRSACGPLPDITLPPERKDWEYATEVAGFIAMGFLGLAEAAALELSRRDPYHNQLLAQIYGQTARFDQARAAVESINAHVRATNEQWGTTHREWSSDGLLAPRDLRTIVSTPVFWRPLPERPRGNVRFVFVGGSMEYVDRRGRHTCVTGNAPDGGSDAATAESVARLNAMVDCEPWYQTAIGVAQRMLATASRSAQGTRPHAHYISYMSSVPREVIKVLTGAPPVKVNEASWTIGSAGKTGWSYERSPDRHIYNAHADFGYIDVLTAPSVAIWAWPDRSDLAVQAWVDTIARTQAPVTVILPDVPSLRSFARRYVRREAMTKVQRTLMEEITYRGQTVHKRGWIFSSEFAPTLVVHPDAREEDGAFLGAALGYLDARHTLRLSVWDLLGDPLLRATVAGMTVPTERYEVEPPKRDDMVAWYGQLPEYDDPMILLRPHRPYLLDQVCDA